MCRITRALLFALLLLPTFKLHAQSVPQAGSAGAELSSFTTFSYANPDYGPNKIYGGSVGVMLQPAGRIGAEALFEGLRFGNTTKHQYAALLGPRLVYYPNRWPKLTGYAALLGGEGQARYPDANGVEQPNRGLEWRVAGGLDYEYKGRIKIRALEFSYSHLYVLDNGLTPMSIGAGLVYQIR